MLFVSLLQLGKRLNAVAERVEIDPNWKYMSAAIFKKIRHILH